MGILQKCYERINWRNRPQKVTALGESNLNHMDVAINELDNRVVNLSATKADLADTNRAFVDLNIDEKKWIITFVRKDGTKATIDFPTESTVVNIKLNDENQMVLVREDGTEAVIDMASFLFSVADSPSIAMSFTDQVISASIIKGAITDDMLSADIWTRMQGYQADAQTAASDSLTYSKDAMRWAVGGVAPGDEQDNSKAYCEQSRTEADRAKIEADKAAQYARITAPDFYVDLETMTLYKKDGSGVEFAVFDNVLCWKTIGAA